MTTSEAPAKAGSREWIGLAVIAVLMLRRVAPVPH
jgi:hypothetical protein